MTRPLVFATLEQKAAWLDAAASLDAASPRVQDIARIIVINGARLALPGERPTLTEYGVGLVVERMVPKTYDAMAAHVHRVVRDGIAYRRDLVPAQFVAGVVQLTRGEELQDTMTILRRGYDDCDGKSRVLVALVRAAVQQAPEPLQLQARIRPVFDRATRAFVHVQPELRWPGSDGWKLAEVIVAGVGIGMDPMLMKDANGRIPMAGPEVWSTATL